MRVLLTGAAGFIGGAVAERLRATGHEVVGVDAYLPEAHGAAAGEGRAADEMHRLDVRTAADDATWGGLLGGVDVVCHQAAMVGAGVTVADLPLYAGHNDLGTAALLAAMSASGVRRLVLASSMVVYGEGRYACPEHGEQRPGPRATEDLDAGRFDPTCTSCGRALGWRLVDEDARLDPRSSYAASKVAQEHYASAWARQGDAAAIGLRYHNVYGPGMPRDTPYSGVAAIFRSATERGEAPQVFEDGAQMRDFVHVRDVAECNRLAVEAVAADTRGRLRSYNVCSGQPVSIREVARNVAGGTDASLEPQVTGEYRSGDVRHVVASPERAAAELGFRAAVAPGEGLAAFAHDPLR